METVRVITLGQTVMEKIRPVLLSTRLPELLSRMLRHWERNVLFEMEIEQLIIMREMKVYYSLLSCRQVIQTTCQKGLLYYASAKQLYILLS